MQQKLIFKRIAMSTLLLSAVAMPTYIANAATGPLVNNYVSTVEEGAKGQITATATTTASAIKFADPLEVAEKYAPETVGDWKETLTKFEEMVKVQTVQIDSADASTISVKAAAGTTSSAIISQAASQVDLKELLASAKEGKAIKVSDSVALKPVSAGNMETLTIATPIEGKALEIKAGEAVPAGTITLSSENSIASLEAVEPASDSFFGGSIALSKAVESKDAGAIKEALAKLLVIYKDQIAKNTENNK